MLRTNTYQRRLGHTLIEVTIALALVALVAVMLVQSMVWSLRERQRLAMRHAAIEIASNVLEAARARPIDQLDQDWADGQAIPSEVAGMLPEGKLLVKVEVLQDASNARRVTAEVRWEQEANTPPRNVTLATVLSGRTTTKKGDEP